MESPEENRPDAVESYRSVTAKHFTRKTIKMENEEAQNPVNAKTLPHRRHIVDPEERRRRILEKGEERLRKILGHSTRNCDEHTVPKLIMQEHQHIPEREPEKPKILNNCVTTLSPDRHSDLNVWQIPFPVFLVLLVILFKIDTLLGIFQVVGFESTFSFVVPFLILECFYLANQPGIRKIPTVRRSVREVLASSFHFQLSLGVFLHQVLSSCEDMIFHFSIYFVSLCLMQIF